MFLSFQVSNKTESMTTVVHNSRNINHRLQNSCSGLSASSVCGESDLQRDGHRPRLNSAKVCGATLPVSLQTDY